MGSEKKSKELRFQGAVIKRNRSKMISLTDMWRAAGAVEHKRPSKWISLDVTREQIDVLAFNILPEDILRTTKGRAGQTWAIPNLAVAYAKYLSPEFHVWANQAILERMEEEDDPSLAYRRGRERAIRGYARRGKDERWIKTRIDGIETRTCFANTLNTHGVRKGVEYAICTNAIYRPILGGTVKEVRLARNMPNGKFRDGLEALELAEIGLSETMAGNKIEASDLQGVAECERACITAGEVVAKAVLEYSLGPLKPANHRRLPGR